MGWWSADVLGGDEPLDAVDAIAERCGLDALGRGECLEVPIDERVVGRVVSYLGNCDLSALAVELGGAGGSVWDDQHRRVAVQVVAVIALAAGVALGSFGDEVVAACAQDDWEGTGRGTEDPERLGVMARLAEAVELQRREGGVIELRSAGLFDALDAFIHRGE